MSRHLHEGFRLKDTPRYLRTFILALVFTIATFALQPDERGTAPSINMPLIKYLLKGY